MASPASAGKGDYADIARNIIPSGQYGSVPPPPEADEQALMYDALTPLFDDVRPSDLNRYFKSERFGVGPDRPVTVEPVPRPGVTIVRDRYNVPHVTAESYDGGIWAAGWIAAQDRGLLLEQARYNARVAAIDAPGLTALELVAGLRSFRPSEQTEAEVAKQTRALRSAGREGRAVLYDIDTFISGINDYLEESGSSNEPWTRNDVYAVNALKGQFLGQGGGDEARRSQFLGGLQQRLGKRKGMSVFNDLRQFKNPESHTAVDGRFNYGRIPENPKGSVVLDPGSFQPTPATPNASTRQSIPGQPIPEPNQASNVLMIGAERSETGHPLLVGGPQIGYFYPGLTYEIDMDAPGLRWRGATSVPFPGYLLIGRGKDFANMLTSAGADIIDQYAETLCGGSDEFYRYNGECRAMERFDAGTLDGEPVSFLRTVHGPVVGYATVDGRRVAISSKRSSYGRDVLDQLLFRRLSTGQVSDPQSFFDAMALTPQTFNGFYIDSKHIAEYTSGRLPQRHEEVDPGLPTIGTGKYEWRGFLDEDRHPHGTDPRDGTIVNWNEGAARGFGAADDSWGKNGSVNRVDLLNYNLKRLRGRDGEWSMADVVSAMNAGATQDVRAIKTVPLLQRLLEGTKPPDARAGRMLRVMTDWREAGGSRLDRDLDGLIDHPGAASMDAAWPKIADALMAPRIGPQLEELRTLFRDFDLPPRGQFSGWHQYFDRDVRELLGRRVERPFESSYCGRGKLRACQRAIWGAIAEAGEELTAAQGSGDPSAWRSDATRERIEFVPGLLPTTIRYTNRPSGIQQVISFKRGG
jgi:acyl-homoserine lactone acylase PvdQ